MEFQPSRQLVSGVLTNLRSIELQCLSSSRILRSTLLAGLYDR